MRSFIFLTILVVALCSCTSLHKKAQDHLDSGAYEQAAKVYEDILKKDPHDGKALHGLQEARDKMIDQGLISVRMARLAGNQQQSLDLLAEIVQNETAWKYSPKTKVAFTQSEESGYASSYLLDGIRKAIQGHHPLQGEQLIRKYSFAFQSQDQTHHFDRLQKEVTQGGKASCLSFQQVSKAPRPYFADFLGRYCNHFGESCATCSEWAKAKFPELVQRLEVTGKVSSTFEGLDSLVSAELKKAFTETSWYDPRGEKKATFGLKGSFKETHLKENIQLIHNYTENEAYQTVENVLKSRQVPYQDYESRYDPISKQLQQVPVTRYRSESYYEPQSVIRYRPVAKTYAYQAIKHHQELAMSLSGSCEMENHPIEVTLSEVSTKEGNEHNVSLSEIGLMPANPELADPQKWIRENLDKLHRQFRENADARWASVYCKADSAGSDAAAVADRVQKCLRSKPSPTPAFVQGWYTNQLGLDFDATGKVLSTE